MSNALTRWVLYSLGYAQMILVRWRGADWDAACAIPPTTGSPLRGRLEGAEREGAGRATKGLGHGDAGSWGRANNAPQTVLALSRNH